ncbi:MULTISPECIES: muconate/chloromuconate family cycloisomerase [unclassified Corynebacterium]|uniref:muconate/chloromuconate family cycloisomerase n=1 Tax=unclassified Corynebacterium TaxID=2624378 RepID=UPI0030A4A588
MSSDLNVSRISTRIIDVPLIRPHGFATYTATAQPILLVEVELAGGAKGYGEGVVPGGPWWGGESVETMQAIVEKYLAPATTNRPVSELSGIVHSWERSVANMRFAKAALEIALFDAWARALNQPVTTLLGGQVRDKIDYTWALGVLPLEEAIAEVQSRIDEYGNRSFKLKMGAGKPEDDTSRVVALVEALGDKVGFRTDHNARWSRLTSLRYLPELAEAGVELFEQPTPAADLATLREIRRVTGVPVMADESVCSPGDALAVVQSDAADVVAIKTTKIGGLLESQRTVAIASAAGLSCHGATSLEGPFGTAASVHFACATPDIDYGSELFGPQLLRESYVETPMEYSDGYVHLPEGPGLGIEPDWSAIDSFTRN